MKISNVLLLALLAVSLLVMPVSAGNNSTPDLMPSLKVGWNGLPASIQSWIFWIISLSFVGLVVVALIYTSGDAIKAIISGKGGDIHGRSSGIGDAFYNVGILIIAIVVMILVIYIASSVG